VGWQWVTGKQADKLLHGGFGLRHASVVNQRLFQLPFGVQAGAAVRDFARWQRQGPQALDDFFSRLLDVFQIEIDDNARERYDGIFAAPSLAN
jgi:hypothetical protein